MNEIFRSLPWYKKLEVLRVARGFTQADMAEKCLTNQKVYWSWEAGERYPRAIYRQTIAKVLGVKQEEIFSDSDITRKKEKEVS